MKSIALSLKTNDRQTCNYRYVAKQLFFLFLSLLLLVFFFWNTEVKPHQWMEAAEVDGKGWAKGKGVYYSVNKPLPVASILEDNACG